MTNAPPHIHPDETFELLSAYVDDALDVVERRKADALLRDCRACALELDELRLLRQALRGLPAPQPKRSFTLDPATVRPRMRLFPIFRMASLVSAMLLVVILGVDLLGAGTRPQATTTLQAPAAGPQGEQLAGEAPTTAPAAEEAAPAAGGAMPQPATGPTEAAAAAAPAPGMPAATAAAAEPAGNVAPEESAAEAAGDAMRSSTPAEEPVPDTAPEAPTIAPEGLSGAGGTTALTKSDTSSQDTTTLEAPRPLAGDASVARPANPWRIAEVILATLAIVLAGMTWWAARQRL